VESRLSSYKEYLNRQQGKYSTLQSQLTKATQDQKMLADRITSIMEAQVVIQQVAIQTQALVIFKIESIVNRVLQAVFPEYSFKLEYKVARGKSEAQLNFFFKDNPVDILDQVGGGVSDVAAIGLRLAVWSLSKTANVLILDEISKFVSIDLQPRVGEVLAELSKSLGLQLIMVSHSVPINEKADALFRIEQDKNGISHVI